MIFMRGKGSYWEEVPPPEGWNPNWPAIFVIALKTKWEENDSGLGINMETLVNGVCNGPIIAKSLHGVNEKPMLWALVPIGPVATQNALPSVSVKPAAS